MDRMEYRHLLCATDGPVGVVRLNRPEVRNALNLRLMEELVQALEAFDADPAVGCILLEGNDAAFAAGADIAEMADAGAVEMLLRDQFARWDRIRRVKKPIVAAVSGYALGGGCELAMLCDIVVASSTAQFGQPEIGLGVMPGAGGTQRLTRAVGKNRAMEMVLTGRLISAQEALAAGLILKAVPLEVYRAEAMLLAKDIAARPPIAVRLAKEAVLKSFDTFLEAGLEFERKNFYLLFATGDAREGMRAFLEKRPPDWTGR